MKTIIAGSRTITNYDKLKQAIVESGFGITEVVSGGANGVDKMGERWARENNIPLKVFSADWDLFGKSAGYQRNNDMAHYADALIVLWDGHSRGTKHMIDLANSLRLKTYIK